MKPRRDDELTAAELALEQHLEGALARALRIRARHVATMVFASQQAGLHMQVADDLMAQHAVGIDWRYRKNGTLWSPLDEAGDRYALALGAEAQAAEAAAKIAELDDMIAQAKRRRPGRLELTGPTPEMLLHLAHGTVGDPLTRLAQGGHLSDDTVRDLREIAAVHAWVTKRVGAVTMRLEYSTAGEPEGIRARGVERLEWMSLLHAFVYKPWSMRCPEARLVLELVVEEQSMSELRRRYRIGWEALIQRVRDGATAYAAERRRFLKTDRAKAAQP